MFLLASEYKTATAVLVSRRSASIPPCCRPICAVHRDVPVPDRPARSWQSVEDKNMMLCLGKDGRPTIGRLDNGALYKRSLLVIPKLEHKGRGSKAPDDVREWRCRRTTTPTPSSGVAAARRRAGARAGSTAA